VPDTPFPSHTLLPPSPVGGGATGCGPGPAGASSDRLRIGPWAVPNPSGLDTSVPAADLLFPEGTSVVLVLPELASGASPGSRRSSSGRARELFLRWFAGPSGSDSPCRVRRGSILDCGGSAVNPRGGNPQ